MRISDWSSDVCGSSQQAIQFAAQAVMSGTQDVVVAAGIESMTLVPMFSATSLALKACLGHPMSPRMNARYGVTEFIQFTGGKRFTANNGLLREALTEQAQSYTFMSLMAT